MIALCKRLSPWQAVLLLVAASTLLRLVAAAAVGLSTDEAHYALYGLHLDWSYFDHPSMVGWLQAIALQFSSSDLAMRVIPVLLFSAASLVLYRLTLTLFPQESPWLGFISVLLLQSAVMFQLIGMSMLPDSPLLLLGLLALLALHGAITRGQVRYWLWLGLWLGLAGLSKYTAVSLIISVLLALTFTRQWRQLRSPGPWLALLLGALLILPVLYWNYRHEWISFLYQLHHGTANPSWKITRLVVSQLAQLLVYGPAIYVFGLVAVVASLREWQQQGAQLGTQLCLALALPVLLLFGWNSGYEMTLPHWTSLGWIALLPLLARWLQRNWNKARWVRVGSRVSSVYAVLLLGVLLSEFVFSWPSFPDNRNPLRDIYGWEQAAQTAEKLRAEMAATPGTPPLLFTENWTYASRLAWYARPLPVQVLDNRFDQFDLWFGAPQNGARGILVVWPELQANPATGGAGQFAACTLREQLPVMAHGNLISTFSFYACDEFKK